MGLAANSTFKNMKFKSLVQVTVVCVAALLGSVLVPGQASAQDVVGKQSLILIQPPAMISAALNSASTNVNQFIGQCGAILVSTNFAGTNPTMAVKLQQSPDGTNFSDMAGGAFTTVTTNAVQELQIDTTALNGSNYIRAVFTLGGTTPTNVSCVIFEGRKKYN